jgi:hypothetical protein
MKIMNALPGCLAAVYLRTGITRTQALSVLWLDYNKCAFMLINDHIYQSIIENAAWNQRHALREEGEGSSIPRLCFWFWPAFVLTT